MLLSKPRTLDHAALLLLLQLQRLGHLWPVPILWVVLVEQRHELVALQVRLLGHLGDFSIFGLFAGAAVIGHSPILLWQDRFGVWGH